MGKTVLTSRAIKRILRNANQNEVRRALEDLDLIDTEVEENLREIGEIISFVVGLIPLPWIALLTKAIDVIVDEYIDNRNNEDWVFSPENIDYTQFSSTEATLVEDLREQLASVQSQLDTLTVNNLATVKEKDAIADELSTLRFNERRRRSEIKKAIQFIEGKLNTEKWTVLSELVLKKVIALLLPIS